MGKLNVGNLEGKFPNYRVTLHHDSELGVGSQLIIQNQQYMPLPANSQDYFDNATYGARGVVKGAIRWNTDLQDIQVYDGISWKPEVSTASYSTLGLIWLLDSSDPTSYSGSGTAWNDISGSPNVYNAQLYAGTSIGQGPTFTAEAGGSLSFDDSDDWVRVDSFAPFFNGRSGDWSLQVWAKPNFTRDGTRGNVLFSLHAGTSNRMRWQVKSNSIFLSDFNTTGDTTYSHAQLGNGEWHLYTMVGNNATNRITLYLDTTQVTEVDMDPGFGETDIDRASIGQEWDGSPSEYFNGLMGLWLGYDRVLTATDVQDNYEATKSRFGL